MRGSMMWSRADMTGALAERLWPLIGGVGGPPYEMHRAGADLLRIYEEVNHKRLGALLEQLVGAEIDEFDETLPDVPWILARAATGRSTPDEWDMLRSRGIVVPVFEIDLERTPTQTIINWDGLPEPRPTRNPSDDGQEGLEAHIVHGMARELYVIAFKLWTLAVDPPPEFPEGARWDDPGVVPDTMDTRLQGLQAARDIEEAVAKENPDLGEYPFARMLEIVSSDLDPEERRYVGEANLAYAFGERLAYVMVGMDEPGMLTQFTLPIIHVELDDDGQDLSYEDRGWNTPHRPTGVVNPSAWPNSSVQSLMFDARRYTVAQAKRWAQDHKFKYGSVDSTTNYHHLRQFDPTPDRPCRTVKFGQDSGIRAVICATSNPAGKPLGIEVLVMEDDPKIQTGVTRMLKQILTNPHVILADNVGAAIADLEVHKFGLVISDVEVRGSRTGLDLFHHVQEFYPDLVDRFVFFTDNPEARRQHYRYLQKGGATAEDLKRVTRTPAPGAPGEAPARAAAPVAMSLADFARQVHSALPSIHEEPGPSGQPMGRFGDKVFVAAIWRALERQPGFRAMTLDQLKRKLVEANRAQLLDLGRIDSRGDADLEEVEMSEIVDHGATFHVVVDREAQRRPQRRDMSLEEFAHAVKDIIPSVRGSQGPTDRVQGRLGNKVFISAAYRAVQRDPRFAGMPLLQFKERLAQANKGALLVLARADLVGAMEQTEVQESEYAPNKWQQVHFIEDDVGEPYYPR